jgi:hypothetical protein
MKIRNKKKGLKKRLSAVMLIYMDSLGNKKRLRLEKYLDKKLNIIVDYYFDLFRKEKRKKIFIPPFDDEVEMPDLSIGKTVSESIVAVSAQGINQQQDIDVAAEQNLNQQEDDIK